MGDVINVEAAIDVTNHAPLRLYVNTCVATLKPDVNTVPKYTFIENQGQELLTHSYDMFSTPCIHLFYTMDANICMFINNAFKLNQCF